MLAAREGRAVSDSIPATDTGGVSVTVFPRDLGWLLEDSLSAGVIRPGLRRTAVPEARFSVEFGISDMHVIYSDIHRQGFFGSKVVGRDVALTLHAKATDQGKGVVLIAHDLQDTARDTIELSSVPSVENGGIPVTRGELPPEGFFSTFAEPLLALSAIAMAVVLLFSVRS